MRRTALPVLLAAAAAAATLAPWAQAQTRGLTTAPDALGGPVWQARFAQINHFEAMLHANGVVIRKCFLHISQDEQRERLLARLDDPTKNWKFRLEDLDDRALWDDYTEAYREALTRCSTSEAPWFVVPADDKALRNYLVARMLVETLESLQLTYPAMQDAVRDAARAFK
jgi:polyphosphate kinase 2 (PPK2 family)